MIERLAAGKVFALELDERIQPGEGGDDVNEVEAFGRRLPRFVVDFNSDDSEVWCDLRLGGLTRLERERRRMENAGMGSFGTVRQLRVFEQEALLTWIANGHKFPDDLAEEYKKMFNRMIQESATGMIGLRRVTEVPEYRILNAYAEGISKAAISDAGDALRALDEMFGWLWRVGYATRSDVYAGAFATEWVDPKHIPEVIGRGSDLITGGAAHTARIVGGEVAIVDLAAGWCDSAAVVVAGVPLDKMRFRVTREDTQLMADETSWKPYMVVQRRGKPSIAGAERWSGGETDTSPLWKVPIPQEMRGMGALPQYWGALLAGIVGRISLEDGVEYRIEYSRDDQGGYVVNSLLPYKPVVDTKLARGEVLTGRIAAVVRSMDDIERLRRQIGRLRPADYVYLPPEVTEIVNTQTDEVIDALVAMPRKLQVLMVAAEGEHRAPKIRQQGGHRLVRIETELNPTGGKKWFCVTGANNGGQEQVVLSRKPLRSEVAVTKRSERIVRGIDVLGLREGLELGLMDEHTLGGKAKRLGEVVRVGMGDLVPPSLTLTQGWMAKLLKANGLYAAYDRLRYHGEAGCGKGGLEGIFERFSRELTKLPRNFDDTVALIQSFLLNNLGLEEGTPIRIMARSTASFEDRPKLSFAGELESVGPILLGRQELAEAILGVVRSYFQPRIARILKDHYGRKELDALLYNLSFPVLIQPVVEEIKAAGVGNLPSRREIDSGARMVLDLSPKVGGIVAGDGLHKRLVMEYDRYNDLVARVGGDRVWLGEPTEGLDEGIAQMVLALNTDEIIGIFEAMMVLQGKLNGIPLDVEWARGKMGNSDDRWWLLQQRRGTLGEGLY